MSEFERALRDAVSGEAATVVSPSYALMARRSRRRRVARATAAAAAVVAVAGGVAVAVPRDEGARLRPAATPAPLKLITGLRDDPAGRAEVEACMVAKGYAIPKDGLWSVYTSTMTYSDETPELKAFPAIYDACLAASGYRGGFADHVDWMSRENARYRACRAYETRLGETTPVGEGTFGGKPWTVHGVSLPDDGFCLIELYEGRTTAVYAQPVPRPGAPEVGGPALTDAVVAGRLPAGFLFVGGVDPRAATVRGVVNGTQYATRAVHVPGVDDRVFYAFGADVGDGASFTYTIETVDADGNTISTSRPATIPLH